MGVAGAGEVDQGQDPCAPDSVVGLTEPPGAAGGVGDDHGDVRAPAHPELIPQSSGGLVRVVRQ
jgi:hypothetical protein